jgi:hypothetical protein
VNKFWGKDVEKLEITGVAKMGTSRVEKTDNFGKKIQDPFIHPTYTLVPTASK